MVEISAGEQERPKWRGSCYICTHIGKCLMKKWQISWDVPEEEPPGLLPLPLGDPLLLGEAELVRLGEPVGVLDRFFGFDPELGLEPLAKGAAGPICSYGQFAPREHLPVSLQAKQTPSLFF